MWSDQSSLETGKGVILTGRGSFDLLIFFRKGLIWLALATVAEIPPVVSPASLSFLPFCLYPLFVVGAYHVEN